jgi:hypothetical protein
MVGYRWAIVGAETGNRKGKIAPMADWIVDLTNQIPNGVARFWKDNLRPYLPHWGPNILKEFPAYY